MLRVSSMATANIFKAAILRTSVAHRPYPSLFFFPGIAQQPFYDPARFSWVDALRQSYPHIRDEFLRAVAEHRPDNDYIPTQGEHTLHQGEWDWFSYIMKGERRARFQEIFPVTSSVLDAIPDLMAHTPTDYAFFSVMRGGTKIAPHYAPHNMRIRCHLPIIVPPRCGIRVAGVTKEWTEGQPFLFDDSYEHETWHDGEGDRVLLLFDTWHPDILPEERAAISEMFASAQQRRKEQVETEGGVP
mmetsp:Transcript_8119/g.25493  ORF Transcript_8119/g.25493 Transcript_8119/m.25493 type:complete len:244 (+) Transcript_8119:1680-2411(+)